MIIFFKNTDTPFQAAIWKKQFFAALLYWIIIPAAVIGGGKVVDIMLNLPAVIYGNLHRQIEWGLVAAGILLIFWSTMDLKKGGGTPSRYRPPKHLVQTGSYSLCRHPMWLGYDVAALGVIMWVGSLGALLVSYPLLLFFSILFLFREERILSLKFKNDYDKYRRQTPFLLPRLPIGRKRK